MLHVANGMWGNKCLKKGVSQHSVFVLITKIYIYLMLSVFLLFVGRGGFGTIQGDKYTAFLVICGGYVVVMAALWIEGTLVGAGWFCSPAKMLRESTWAQRAALAYLALTWLSALCSAYFPETVLGVTRCEGALSISIYVLCFLLLSVFGRADKPMLVVAGVSITLFCVLSIVQMFDYNPLGLYPDGYSYSDAYTAYSGAYLGTIGNVDLVAAFLCLAIPVLWILLVRMHGRARILLLIPLALALAVLAGMSVLAGIVGVAVGSILAAPMVFLTGRRARVRAYLGVAALFAAFAVTVYAVDIGGGFLHELHELLHGRASGSFGTGRLHIWSEVLGKLPQYLLLGSGPDTMSYAGLEAFTRYDPNVDMLLVSEIDVAHNEYLNIAFSQGIFALAAYLGLLLCCARSWAGRAASDTVVCALGGAALCYCVQAFFGIAMCITEPFFWLVLGLLESRANIKEKEHGGKTNEEKTHKFKPGRIDASDAPAVKRNQRGRRGSAASGNG